MRNRGEVVLLTLIVVFIIGGISAVTGYIYSPYHPQPVQAVGKADIPHIPAK